MDSQLSQQVNSIIERLHGLFNEIGVPTHQRDARESELFAALSETLHNQLSLVTKEKHDLTEEATRLIKTIKQMERSLDDTNNGYSSDDESLEVTHPLLGCIQKLKQKHNTIAKLHRERYEQVKKLVEALESYASHLEPSFVKIKLPPTSPNAQVPPTFDLSPTYVQNLDDEFTRVYEEYNKRVEHASQLADEIINLWSELGTPQAQVDSQIVEFARTAPEQLGLHQDDLKRLRMKRDKLVQEKQQRERRIKELHSTVEGLWDRLSVEDSERRQFLAANRGCGLRQINEFEDELSRLNELKRQNLHLFVEDARFKLQELWDGLYFSEEEMLDFAPAFSDVYSDALLSAHEQEITRLEALKEQRAPILAAIERHRSLIKDREDLANSSQDASRLMAKGAKGEKRDPGKLLREEKMRKRIAKELPKVEADLRKTLEAWEDEYGRPFCVHGERYIDDLDAAQAKAPPTRSKTPNALGSTREPPKSAGRSAAPSRAGTMRGPPPPQRSKTPTANTMRGPPMSASTMSSSVMGSSVSAASAGRTSPSKLPTASRLPMSNLRDGNNSPERTIHRPQTAAAGHYSANTLQHSKTRSQDLNSTIRGGSRMAPPGSNRPHAAIAPPPKMKDLFIPPTPTPNPFYKENSLETDPSRSVSVIRHAESEDPYSESPHSQPKYRNNPHTYPFAQTVSNTMPPPPSRPHPARSNLSQDSVTSQSTTTTSSRPTTASSYVPSQSKYSMAPPSSSSTNRQISNTSSNTSYPASSSENWETYTDGEESVLEVEPQRRYYGGLKQAGKRLSYEGQGGGGKRVRSVEEGEVSEGGWTDDLGEGGEGVGDTY